MNNFYYIKIPIRLIEPNINAFQHSIAIDEEKRANGTPFIAYSNDEFDAFEKHWCDQCQHEENDYCDIHNNALMQEQPNEWVYYNNKPVCTKWKMKNG